MLCDLTFRPRLRPVEAFPIESDNGEMVALRDRSGLSDVVLSMSAPALHILALMDGEHTVDDIRRTFGEQFGQSLSEATLNSILTHLDRAHFLEGESFEAHYCELLDAYRRTGVRNMPHAAGLGIDASGAVFHDMLNGSASRSDTQVVVGLIVPHLDYPRGKPCYAAGYARLHGTKAPNRVVILGTNHFGRSPSVVTTGNDFVTPLGRTRVDTVFLEKLESRCGHLRTFELDHAREHSIELQVAWLQFLFGADAFSIVPFLCPDPCGPTGTAPRSGSGVDLADFAETLRAIITDSDGETLLVAGADFSHVGAQFGDDRPLDDVFLQKVRARDREALEHLADADPLEFVQCLARDDNSTRVCSAGCMFVLATALSHAKPAVLDYHQAVDPTSQTCVTCAAVVYTASAAAARIAAAARFADDR